MITDADLIRELASQAAEAGSRAAWAKEHGFSRGFVSDVLAGTRAVTERLAKALGYESAGNWKKAGAEPCHGRKSTRKADGGKSKRTQNMRQD